MIHDLTTLALLQGLLLLVLMWWAWSAYCWLGNQWSTVGLALYATTAGNGDGFGGVRAS